MGRRLAVLSTCVVMITLAVGWATAFGGSSVTSRQTIRLTEKDTLDSAQDQGVKGPSAADEFFAYGKFRDASGHVAGTFEGACTLISSPSVGAARCEGTASLSRGQIEFEGAASFNSTTIQLGITGGTGTFRDARGYVTVTGFGTPVSGFIFHVDT